MCNYFWSTEHQQRILRGLWLCLIGLATVHAFAARPVQAAGPLNWTPPAQIPYLDPNVNTPFLLTDSAGVIHAFSSQRITESWTRVIVYNRWQRTTGWSEPVDILLSPLHDEAHAPAAYLDRHGIIHLVFFGGHDVSADIYYSRAPALLAANANAWTPPVPIATGARPPITVGMAGDTDDHLYVLYGGNPEGTGIYATSSHDGGDTWTLPDLMFGIYTDDLWPFGIRMHYGASGRLYAVWNVVNRRGWGVTGYLATYDFTTGRWHEASVIDEGVPTGILGLQGPSLIERSGELFVMYDNGIPEQGVVRLVRRSDDGGRTWSEAVRPFPLHVGGNGPSAFVLDSANQLRVFFGQRTAGPLAKQIHGMWYSEWHEQARSWGGVYDIVSGPLVQDVDGDTGFDPSAANAIVIQGNLLMIVWRTDPGNGANGAWYSYAEVETPITGLVALPTLTPTPIPVKVTRTMLPTSTPTLLPVALAATESAPQILIKKLANPAAPLVAGLIPVGIFLSVMLYRLSHRRRF
ncbi:MAG: sialidase family protein [Caldilineaceae bacterium]